ncbi:MAG: iron-containing alcohol dehydrogenase [Oscillospiraceae bacterium]|nr:iron-containing alcohol dehydrogenase [Oscillospiraceae bacterium]
MRIKKKFLTSMQLMSCGIIKLKKVDITERFNGSGSVLQIADIIRAEGINKVLIVSGKTVNEKKLADPFVKKLHEYNINHEIFVVPGGSFNSQCFEEGYSTYISSSCDAVMAFGGGTVIDCAKLIALKAANPSKNIAYFTDFTAVPKKAVPLYAAPTTPGSGSEISMLSFYTDEKGRKLPILSSEFVPRAAALDPDLIMTLPPELIAYCGMSTLTRAIESYISTYSERFYRDTVNAPKACRMVFENLYDAFIDPDNKTARLNLLKASYYAGISFRRSAGGYIQSISHRMSELYGVHHGLADAVLLPYVLEEYMPEVIEDLSVIAYHCDFSDDKDAKVENAFRIIEQIRDLNQMLGIPDYIKELQDTDVPLIIKRTQNDAKLCGCPKILMDNDLEKVFSILSDNQTKAIKNAVL